MKRFLLLIVLLCTLPVPLGAENRPHEQGTIVRMRMADCLAPRHTFMSTMSGGGPMPNELCPEYVLVAEKVVYVIVGKSSDQLLPLAETSRFHVQNNEVLIRIDDARRESHFHVKEMILRPEWERYEQIAETEALAQAHHHLQNAAAQTPQQ